MDLKNFLSARGRIGRLEYFLLESILAACWVAFALIAPGDYSWLIFMIFLLFSLLITLKRVHDVPLPEENWRPGGRVYEGPDDYNFVALLLMFLGPTYPGVNSHGEPHSGSPFPGLHKTTPSTTAGEDSTEAPVAKRHTSVPLEAGTVVAAAAMEAMEAVVREAGSD